MNEYSFSRSAGRMSKGISGDRDDTGFENPLIDRHQTEAMATGGGGNELIGGIPRKLLTQPIGLKNDAAIKRNDLNC